MNKEEIDKWLDNEYGCSYTRLEELHDFYFERYCDLKEKNKHLKDKIDNAIERLEALIVFWEKYNPIDNTMQVEQFKDVIEILKEDK